MNDYVKDIATIAAALEGKVTFSKIEFNQRLLAEDYREIGVNNLVYIKKGYGVYFYTLKSALEDVIMLRGEHIPVLVGCPDSFNIYEISR